MRSGFNLVTTIFFMILISTIGIFALSLSTTTAKQTSDIYLREQAQILAKSGTEMAIFELLTQNKPFAIDCPVGKEFSYFFPDNQNPIFEISVIVVEMFGNFNNCGSKIQTKESYATLILDTFVKTGKALNKESRYKNDNNQANFVLKFHKRTIQKL